MPLLSPLTLPPFFCIPGSLAIPAPSILLVPPHPSSQEDPIHIACVAPGGFPGANFTLYRGGQVVQFLQAPADQLRVTFNVTGGDREAPGGTFCCQYGVLAEHRQERLSDLSKPLQVSFPGPTWILALSLSLAGVLLLAGLVTVAVVVRKDMTFDNSLFAISMTMNPEEDAVTVDACSDSTETPGSSGPRKRPTSTSSSPEPPEFSTFRSCQ
ncbi:protein HIDE1 isoform X3 [Vulpes lagopus]|uniref:protein HIDE1 isoform X3 n=1 Tax=Vulpes lagopus TaxID=494514 RepID=UPI001BC9D8C8|nr:protein HIDE1 isoform X3 [Vulpes lagopus]